MSRVQSLTIREFMSGDYPKLDPLMKRIVEHLERNKVRYKIVGMTIIVFLTATDIALASGTGIDVGARKIYTKLLVVAKWVIIIKGGWDTINNTVKGDLETAKKSFLSYLLVYVILLALPWALSEVDSVFAGM
ncbi:hypothetical protein MUG84_00065 [Paenibacillus sp. KQZ6P-2]|uniref:Uncharacterized protein n=1 Tax=Paenibacillus mangrovi TaxID=2931978 RepID=A0A9X1WJP6_9BACL|nr:hypothetical protein [Paenibacillus mangrovi]MCJ8010134.1 hypothetical protein [Paenibacillus mangrovi]